MGDNNFLRSIQSTLGPDFNLGLLISSIKKSLVWIILFLFIAALSVVLYLRYTTPIYESSGTLMLKSEKTGKILGTNSDFLALDRNEILREIQLMKATSFMNRVYDSLDFEISYFIKGKTKLVSTELYPNPHFVFTDNIIYKAAIKGSKINIDFLKDGQAILNYYVDGKNRSQEIQIGENFETSYFGGVIYKNDKIPDNYLIENDYYFTINSSREYVSNLIQNIVVSSINPNTQTLKVSFKDGNAVKGRDIVNKVIEEFRIYDLERKQESANSILKFLNEQSDQFKNELILYQDSIREFRLKNNFISPEREANNIFERLSYLEEQKEKLSYDLNIIDWYVSYIDELSNLRLISPGLLEEQLSSSIKYVELLLELEKEKESVLRKATSEHPKVKLIEKEIEDVKFSLNQELSNNLKRLNFRISSVNEKYDKEFSRFFELPEKEAEFERLNRKYKINESYYLNLLEKKIDFSIARAGIVSDYIVLEHAKTPLNPVGLEPSLIWLSAIFLALILGLFLIALRYFLHNSIISIDQIKANTSASILGIVSSLKGEDLLSPIIVLDKPKSQIAESFRTIRSNLQFLTSTESSKKIAISSTISGEGKTFISLNIAGILAQLNKKVILVDLDMRRPRLNSIFEIENSKGLSTILVGRDLKDDCLFHYKKEKTSLDIITSGPIPPNPAELILSDNFKKLVKQLEVEYDYIVFDTPPVGLVTDGLEIIKWVDYPIYVFRADYSKKEFVSNLDNLITENKIDNLSIVLNDIGRGDSAYSYSYGYSYGYGYGYGYGSGYYVEQGNEKKSIFKRFFS